MKIYTKRGDQGLTSLFDGAEASKASLRVRAYGEVDELNAVLGVARQACSGEARLGVLDEALAAIQADLFALGAVLADPRRDASAPPATWTRQVAFDASRAHALEALIDAWDGSLPPLTNFILPGGSAPAASLHVARTVARRAERSVVELASQGGGTPEAVVYLNRLSDLLFVAARWSNAALGVEDIVWRAGD
jgi:cob(I)alamin adenosyltransferase